jgi:hypothetical protein
MLSDLEGRSNCLEARFEGFGKGLGVTDEFVDERRLVCLVRVSVTITACRIEWGGGEGGTGLARAAASASSVRASSANADVERDGRIGTRSPLFSFAVVCLYPSCAA